MISRSQINRSYYVTNCIIKWKNFLKQRCKLRSKFQNVKCLRFFPISSVVWYCGMSCRNFAVRVAEKYSSTVRMGKFTRLFPTSLRFVNCWNIHEWTSRTSVSDAHSERIADSASSLSIHIDSLTSAPFCITVHRPGRLPIMSLHSYKDVVCHKFNLNRSSSNFSEAALNLRGEKSAMRVWLDEVSAALLTPVSHKWENVGSEWKVLN